MVKHTRAGIDCPACGEPGSTAFVAQFPIVTLNGTTATVRPPNEFSVCTGCYYAERVRRYGELPPAEGDRKNGALVRTLGRLQLERHPETEGQEETLALLNEWREADAATIAAMQNPEPTPEPEPEPVAEEG